MLALGIDIGGSSVKAAALESGRVIGTARSGRYARPAGPQVVQAIREAVTGLGVPDRQLDPDAPVGLCVPGIVDPRSMCVTVSMNVPGLIGLPLPQLVRDALPGLGAAVAPRLFSDARAAAHDWWAGQSPSPAGRLLALSLGTGVGCCVLDDGAQLLVTGVSSGHLGQMDVSQGEPSPPVGPDGGTGSLEAYIGLPALLRRSAGASIGEGSGGDGLAATFAALDLADPAIRALMRAIRIAHAIYRPDHVVLLGGVGIRLARLAGVMESEIKRGLTALARPGWTLRCGNSDFHAACGVARLASADPHRGPTA